MNAGSPTCSRSIAAGRGCSSLPGQLAGSQIPLRTKAFGQCVKTSSTCSTSAARGGLPTAVSDASSSGSALTQARPLARRVLTARPG